MHKSLAMLHCLFWLFLIAGCARQPNDARHPEAPSTRTGVDSPKPALATAEQPQKESPPPAEDIRKLIARLAEMEHAVIGLSPSLSGRDFAPLAGRERVNVLQLTDADVGPFEPFRRLVELGPHALPPLLGALDDQRPTKITINASNGLAFLGNRKSYTVKIGDVCYVALGQIVGRPHEAVSYFPSGGICLGGPMQYPKVAKELRATWSGENPVQRLRKALLADYRTKPVFNGKDLEGWDEGSDLVYEAALRLLYYFPADSVPLIAERLKRLDASETGDDADKFIRREVANGVNTGEFIRASMWSREPAIRDALFDIFRRTTDPHLLLTVLPAIDETQAVLIPPRLERFIDRLPESESSAEATGHHLLLALAKRAGKGARPVFERYLQKASLQRRWTMCLVLAEINGDWAIDFLAPMLTDKRTGLAGTYDVIPGQGDRRNDIRLCDTAAETISAHNPEMSFKLAGEYEELDRQIAVMRAQIGRMK
jgi:hypothetical protein